jgi:hypothetical protein
MKSGTSDAKLAELAAAGANTAANTMMWPWAVMQQAMAARPPEPAAAPPEPPAEPPAGPPPSSRARGKKE